MEAKDRNTATQFALMCSCSHFSRLLEHLRGKMSDRDDARDHERDVKKVRENMAASARQAMMDPMLSRREKVSKIGDFREKYTVVCLFVVDVVAGGGGVVDVVS